MADTRLDQLVKGQPQSSVSPAQIADSTKSINSPLPPPSTHNDPRNSLPSSPPQIYLNLLILESSLRLQYLSLRTRLRLHVLLLIVLTAWITLFTYLLFFRPREDGNGVGGSVYWVIESAEKLGWCGGVVTLCLFWGTGMYERGVRWPRKFVGTTNRGLRGFNMKVIVVKGGMLNELTGWLALLDPLGWFREQKANFHVVPKDIEMSTAKDHWNSHAAKHGLIEEDVASSGDTLKLLLLPKPFSPDFRQGWETYRMEYWEKENSRRSDLRNMINKRKWEIARREGGWLWWTGWRGWKNVRIYSRKTRRQIDLEKLALKEKPSAERLKEKRRREGLLGSEPHSRSSSRSSTPGPTNDRVRRGSGTARRPPKKSSQHTSRLSATETLFQEDDSSPPASKRSSSIASEVVNVKSDTVKKDKHDVYHSSEN